MSKKTFKDNPALQFISDLPQQAESSEQPQSVKSWDDIISSPAPDQSTASSAEGFRKPAAKISLSGRLRFCSVIAKGLSGFAVCKDQPQLSVRRLEA